VTATVVGGGGSQPVSREGEGRGCCWAGGGGVFWLVTVRLSMVRAVRVQGSKVGLRVWFRTPLALSLPAPAAPRVQGSGAAAGVVQAGGCSVLKAPPPLPSGLGQPAEKEWRGRLPCTGPS
jgi:hypothetical protein